MTTCSRLLKASFTPQLSKSQPQKKKYENKQLDGWETYLKRSRRGERLIVLWCCRAGGWASAGASPDTRRRCSPRSGSSVSFRCARSPPAVGTSARISCRLWKWGTLFWNLSIFPHPRTLQNQWAGRCHRGKKSFCAKWKLLSGGRPDKSSILLVSWAIWVLLVVTFFK